MVSLVRYIAGGAAVILALDLVSPMLPGLEAGFHLSGAPAVNVVNRTSKGDKAATAAVGGDQDNVIATVEVVGLRDAAVVYRARDGRVLFSTDPVTNATVVVKGVVLPEVTIRETRRTAVEPATPENTEAMPAPSRPSAAPSAAKAEEKKILEGCDPAFSPLTASARNNFSGRCLAALEPSIKVAAVVR
jgi:hypothetical protein